MYVYQVEMTNIQVFTIQVFTNGASSPPGDTGVTAGVPPIDVEHLLIRTYVGGFGWYVRNISKVAAYYNYSGQRLNWSVMSTPATAVIDGPHNFHLNAGQHI